MNFEFVDWNVEAVKKSLAHGKGEQDFINAGLAEGHYRKYSHDDQVKLLREAYRLILLEITPME